MPASAPGGEAAPVKQRRRYAPRVPADQRREQVLDVALSIAVSRGLGAVNMEAIARESGVTKPVVYGTFANTEAVFEALVEREQARAFTQLQEALPVEIDLDDPLAIATAGIAGFLSVVRANPDTWKLLLAADQLPAKARKQHAKVRAGLVQRISVLAELGLRVRPSGPLDADLLAHLIVGGVETGIRLVLDDPEVYTEARMAAFVGELVRAVWEG